VSRSVFWPVPNVDSGLVAFAQRRKTLRAALARWAGSPAAAERLLRAAGVDPAARGESLTIAEFTRIAGTASSG